MNPLLIVTGPTASGKTAVACELSKLVPAEMISFDSMQVYRRMDTLTQAPAAKEKKMLRAHLVTFLDPAKPYDAARFRKDALALIAQIQRRKRLPLLSGGTGLYLRMLLDGLFDTPETSTDPKLRQELLSAQERNGGDHLHKELSRLDPAAAAKIHPNDHRRLVRAIEVCRLTGGSFTAQKSRREGIRDRSYCPIFFLDRDREDLYRRIDKRVDRMMKDGLLKEVKVLRKKKLSLTASQALGLRQLGEHLDGKRTLSEAVTLLKQHTRNYAKRQISWFRHEKGVQFVAVTPDERPSLTAKKILKLWKEGQG